MEDLPLALPKSNSLESVSISLDTVHVTYTVYLELASSSSPFPEPGLLYIGPGNETMIYTMPLIMKFSLNYSLSENGVVDWFERLDLQQYLKGFVQRVRHNITISYSMSLGHCEFHLTMCRVSTSSVNLR